MVTRVERHGKNKVPGMDLLVVVVVWVCSDVQASSRSGCLSVIDMRFLVVPTPVGAGRDLHLTYQTPENYNTTVLLLVLVLVVV